MIIGKSLTALGGGGLKPEITVTAKAGALLNLHYKDSSIILQSYQLGAEETTHTFVVNVSETAYVVEDVTDGKSVEVLVDAVAQYSVEIKYVRWVYNGDDGGNEFPDFTGGLGTWAYTNTGCTTTITKEENRIYCYSNGANAQQGIYTKSTIDISGYSKLCAEFLIASGINNNYAGFRMGLKTSTGIQDAYAVASDWANIGTTYLEMDISSYTGNYYIAAHMTYVANGYIYKIWLE